MAETQDYGSGGAPAAHKTQHENEGSDEINVDGLSGRLEDPQPPDVLEVQVFS